MNNGRHNPDAITDAELRRLYIDEHLSMRAIGSMIGMGAPSVLHRLRRAGIPTRPVASPHTKDILEPLVARALSKRQIGEDLGISAARVSQLLQAYGLTETDGRSQPRPVARQNRRMYSGYWMLQAPDHPHADKRGYVVEHRLVMERKLGRYLDPREIVHHMNHMRDDNRPENLMLLPNQSAHSKLHAQLRREDSR